MVRARVKWIEEGEKNTKYFLSLEQKRAASNTIKQIQSDQDEINQTTFSRKQKTL